jgi:hypothetical protein
MQINFNSVLAAFIQSNQTFLKVQSFLLCAFDKASCQNIPEKAIL